MAALAVDRRDPGAKPQLDVLRGVEAGRAQRQALGGRLALEPALRERRPLIGRDRLLADQGDGALPAILPQEGGGRTARVTSPRDDDARCLLAHAVASPCGGG